MARNSRVNTRAATPRRRMFWARRTQEIALTTADTAITVNLLADFETAYGADLFGFTITRIRGHFWYRAPNSGGASNPSQTSWGIRTDEASEASAATDAEQQARLPQNDPFVDWMYVRNQSFLRTTLDANAASDQALQSWEIDIKAQRRLDELGQSLFLYVGFPIAPVAGSNSVFGYDLHVLCKRP